MKTWFWWLFTILTLIGGCAQGYYDQRAAYPGTATMTWTQNPESEGEYQMRIWSEDAGGH